MKNRVWIAVIVASLVWLSALTLILATHHTDQKITEGAKKADERQDSSDLFACRRRSQIIAAQIVDAGQNKKLPTERQAGYMDLYAGIADCKATVRSGRLVLLAPAARDAFVHEVGHAMGFPEWNKQPDGKWAP